MEHRCTGRYKTQIQAKVTSRHHGSFRGDVIEISPHGAFIASTQSPMPPNTPVIISLESDQYGPRLNMEIVAIVVHHTAAGFGVMFEELEPPQQRVLDRLVHWLKKARAASESPTQRKTQKTATG